MSRISLDILRLWLFLPSFQLILYASPKRTSPSKLSMCSDSTVAWSSAGCLQGDGKFRAEVLTEAELVPIPGVPLPSHMTRQDVLISVLPRQEHGRIMYLTHRAVDGEDLARRLVKP